jgi:hypothetical protein
VKVTSYLLPVTGCNRLRYLFALFASMRENPYKPVTTGNSSKPVTLKRLISYRALKVLRPANSVKSSSEKEPLLDVLCRLAQHI